MRDDPPSITLPEAKLDDYVGTYQLAPGKQVLKAELADLFFVPGEPRLRRVFERDANGQVTGFVERRETWDISWSKAP